MLSTPHLLVGAVIGKLLPYPAAAFVGGVVSHFILDQIPHWDPGTKLAANNSGSDEIEPSNTDWIFGGAELVFGFVLVLYIVNLHSPLSISSPLLWGALGGVTPDLIDNVPFWKNRVRPYPFFKQLHQLHERFHFNLLMRYRLFGAVTQAIIIVGALIFLNKN